MAGWAASGSRRVHGACGPATPGSGGDDTGRRAHLHRVLGLCRLLVRPGIGCRNLASHVLGRAARAVGDDCERLYGYRPWLLETFVDETDHTGASVRAANWVRVGETCGRGRGDRTHAAPETRKAVYMYELEPACRARLAAPAPAVAPLAVGDGLDAASWANHEFGGARLGDARLSARLVRSAQQMAESPTRAITGATNGARALVKGHYRLIDQPADSAVTVGNILAPHRERTLRRMQAHDTVLCIQDGTRLNFTRRGQTQGLGAIGSNQTGAVARGLELHTTLAVNPDGGGAGRAAGRLRRARRPRGARPADPEAARGAQVVPLGRGAARLTRAESCRSGKPGAWCGARPSEPEDGGRRRARRPESARRTTHGRATTPKRGGAGAK